MTRRYTEEELQQKITDLVERYNVSPRFYTKEDFVNLVDFITKLSEDFYDLSILDISSVALSGSYNDLLNKPVIESGIVTLTTLDAIGGYRGVTIDENGFVIYADKDNNSNCIGISLNAAEARSTISIKFIGEITESNWSWIPGEPIYLNNNGILTQVPPTTGSIVFIGKAITETKILINIEQPIIL